MAYLQRGRQDSMQSTTSSLPWNRPPSPTFSTTTTGSKVNLSESHTLISRKDLRASIACFEQLMAAAKAYRNALLAMSTATAAFASAMEACSRVKGCRGANAALAGGAGLQYLISNHEQLLADTVYRQFEIPLLEALDNYKLITADRLVQYEKSLHAQSDKIRKTEAENMKIGRRRKRDLQQFRTALAELQSQVDELDNIKLNYHEEVLEAEDENWETVLNKVAFVVRSQLDFYEKIAGKASDPVLEPLAMSIPDPFDAYGPPKEEGQLFSVLSPLNLDSQPTSPTPNITRISQGGSNTSTPRAASPAKLGVPMSSAQTSVSTVDAVGERGMWDDDFDRARRELSVIDEREGSPERNASPVRSQMEEDVELVPPEVIVEEHVEEGIEDGVQAADNASDCGAKDDDGSWDHVSPSDHVDKRNPTDDSDPDSHDDDDDHHKSQPGDDTPDQPTVNDDLSQGSHDDHHRIDSTLRVEVTA